jgi:hypothetical protein
MLSFERGDKVCATWRWCLISNKGYVLCLGEVDGASALTAIYYVHGMCLFVYILVPRMMFVGRLHLSLYMSSGIYTPD